MVGWELETKPGNTVNCLFNRMIRKVLPPDVGEWISHGMISSSKDANQICFASANTCELTSLNCLYELRLGKRPVVFKNAHHVTVDAWNPKNRKKAGTIWNRNVLYRPVGWLLVGEGAASQSRGCAVGSRNVVIPAQPNPTLLLPQ